MVLTLLAITFVSAAAVGTIYEITQEPIAAAKSANAHSFIRRLPQGYDTVITGDGASLSQGQRQPCRDRTRSDMRSRHFPTADSAVKSA